jgi:hypothetical protein
MYWISFGPWSHSAKMFFIYERVHWKCYPKYQTVESIPKGFRSWWYKKFQVWTPFVKVRKRYSTWLGYFKKPDGSFISWRDLEWERK